MRSEGAGGAWKNLTEECAGAAPSPRSGHRAAVLGGRMVIFGGFFDNGKEEKEYPPAGYSMGFRRGKGKGGDPPRDKSMSCSFHSFGITRTRARGRPRRVREQVRYYNDLHVLHLAERRWAHLGGGRGAAAPAGQLWPSPRSGCGLAALSKDSLLLLGGYAREGGAAAAASEVEAGGAATWDLWRCQLPCEGKSRPGGKGTAQARPPPAPRSARRLTDPAEAVD